MNLNQNAAQILNDFVQLKRIQVDRNYQQMFNQGQEYFQFVLLFSYNDTVLLMYECALE